MYNKEEIEKFTGFLLEQNGEMGKGELSEKTAIKFNLVKEGKVFKGKYFSVRFSSAKSKVAGNTVLALSKLLKYDDLPFFVCVVTPAENILLIANTTFIKKISHSSHNLTIDNIRGSFNLSDIERFHSGLENRVGNFATLFEIHEEVEVKENIQRIVEATQNIVPTKKKFVPSEMDVVNILYAPQRTIAFMESQQYAELKGELDQRTNSMVPALEIIQQVDNVNLRGRLIEYFIASNEEEKKQEIIKKIKANRTIDDLTTDDALGDYCKNIGSYEIQIDIKSKLTYKDSNPKGYNIDKLLCFLSRPASIYLLYIVAIDAENNVNTSLLSIFQDQILEKTRIQKHWAGRDRRGEAQLDGVSLKYLVSESDCYIDIENATSYLRKLISIAEIGDQT